MLTLQLDCDLMQTKRCSTRAQKVSRREDKVGSVWAADPSFQRLKKG